MQYKDLNVLANNINSVIGSQETKIQKKLAKIYQKLEKCAKEYDEKIQDLRLDFAATDDKGVLMLNDKGGYTFKKEDLKKLNEQLRKLDDQEFEFSPIEVVNPQGLEQFSFLKDWTSGILFINEEEL